jgi:hypothetical protein
MWNDFHENSIKSHRARAEVANEVEAVLWARRALRALVLAQPALTAKSTTHEEKNDKSAINLRNILHKNGKALREGKTANVVSRSLLKKAIGF